MAPAAILVGVTVAAAAVSAVGVAAQAKAAQQAANFNAARAQQNATLSIQQATEDEREFRIFSRKALGDIRSAYGASGVSMEGSGQDVIEEGAAQAELDALKIRHAGAVKAAGFSSDASLDRMKADSLGKQGYFSAAGELLGGAKDALKYA